MRHELLVASTAMACPAPSAERHAMAAAEWMAAHLPESFKMETVAEAVGISYHYLRHVFHHRFGVSMAHWLLAARIERARQLVTHSEVKLAAVAGQCGFANERYLCTVFRRFHGRSPASLRRR
jgi:transcriptional regulator GlxA family with amidase domain